MRPRRLAGVVGRPLNFTVIGRNVAHIGTEYCIPIKAGQRAMIPFNGAYRTGALVGVSHLVLVVLTALYVYVTDQISGLAWVVWAVMDFPISVLGYSLFGLRLVLVHAVVGSLWWFILITVVWSL